MGKALYRKYRSRSLSEIVGQEHITSTLGNALATHKIAHAYLLTGPRGVGKTSIARILAHEINALPYSEEPHFDIIEIDAASNNGVEDVRDLRDKILSAPTSAKYKVFIIDEVHMLSKAAFNALLKTLEEPPAHVVFILATTEAHKLPATILSRVQRFTFRPGTPAQVIEHLRSIAKKEKIDITDDALALIASHGEGSFRDSVGLLDQASSFSPHITVEEVERLIGRAPASEIENLLASMQNQQPASGLQALRELLDHGYEPAMIAMQLGQNIRTSLQQTSQSIASQSLTLLKDLLDVPASQSPDVLLELIVLQHSASAVNAVVPSPVKASSDSPITNRVKPTEEKTQSQVKSDDSLHNPESSKQPNKQKIKASEAAIKAASPEPASEQKQPSTPSKISTPQPEISNQTASAGATPTNEDSSVTELWQSVLDRLKKTHNTLYGIARMAKPSLSDDTLQLGLKFKFHQKRLSESRNLAILTGVVEELRGTPTQILCTVLQNDTADTSGPDTLAAISNIFGGAELLD